MYAYLQSRTLAVDGAALPTYGGEPVLTPVRLSGGEKLGRLYSYTLDLATANGPIMDVLLAKELISAEALIGQEIAISIEFEGSGTFESGRPGLSNSVNLGAGRRTITGLITAVSCTGASDRQVFYRFTVRPWLWLATRNRENRIFQNQSVVEITESILKGGRYPFPYELQLAAPGFSTGYPKRDYVRQFWCSDFDFLSMLWRHWGLYFFMQESTLVLCDSPGSHRPHGNAYDTIQYHAPGGKRIDEEHISELELSYHLTAGATYLTDYDYTRSRASLGTAQNDPSDSAFDNAEQYAWGDYSQPLAGAMGLSGDPNDHRREAEALARVHVDALRCRSLRARGRGNVRGLATGHTFYIENHPIQTANAEYLVVATTTDVRNVDDTSQRSSSDARYQCVTDFVVQPANTFFKNRQKVKRKPRCEGETAVVVGPAAATTWIDGYARVKVRFHWDRVSPSDQNASCWLRVLSPWQGNGFGTIYSPRIGQEVMVLYHEGNPDKPYVCGRMVNQFNQPPWKLPDNEALSGTRSRELNGAMANSIVVDDTKGELQVQIESEHAQSRLVLGYNTRIDGNAGRRQARGEGWELATDSWGVLRANKGMLVTTETRDGAQAPAKDMSETIQRLMQAGEQHGALALAAQRHSAQEPGTDQSDVARTIHTQNDAIRGGARTTVNPFPEMTRPDMVLASAAGIGMTAADSVHIAAGENVALTTGSHVSISAGRSIFASIRERLSVFVQQLGIKLIAASGKVEIQAQSDSVEIIADQVLKLISARKRIEITAAEEILLNARGSYIRINGAGIEHGTPAKWVAHAGSHALPGPKSLPVQVSGMDMPKAFSNRLDVYDIFWRRNFAEVEYTARNASGDLIAQGTLDEDGRTPRLSTDQSETIHVLVGTKGAWLVETEGVYSPGQLNGEQEAAGDEPNHYVNLGA
ncbi:type VI secretion system Vgr family protein [Paraburkholderia caledonica]|uniref:Type VI secretion system secreted protein VgrG n=1 Tax=Paraburkholderia caledonica TaxID=134536 RepID=A0ABU1KUS5_9BURK|nr:type VI secretion system tip protein TssI/VgrG [Paraburkholderia caledonica]MDR6374706.1 type VI secretion system secreted protein VgrG [Paraburkholderia caledonica]